jgi:glycosyltransferase involved in cell wall biosynthesis
MWVLAAFFIVTSLRLLYYLILSKSLESHRDKEWSYTNIDQGVSIIIASKNEEQNLARLVPKLLSQEYQNFEIIIVDDFSIDNTSKLFFNDDKVKIVKAEEDRPGKKAALTKGINTAKYDLLLFTDADCNPNSDRWISKMTIQLEDNKDIVIGYSPMQKENHFTGLLGRFETIHTALLYLGFSKLGMSYMGVGRNLLYRKCKFMEVGGYTSHAHIPAGDDDLQVQKMANNENVAICLDPDTWMITSPKQVFTTYLNQKSRHVGVASQYLTKYQILLGMLAGLQIAFYALAAFGVWKIGWPMGICFGAAIGLLTFVFCEGTRRFNEEMIGVLFPIFDLAFLLLNPIFFLKSLGQNGWK